jgi:hypothetical protein
MSDVVEHMVDAERYRSEASVVDVLICTLGFEDRCTAVARALAASGCHVDHAVLLTYSNSNDTDNRRLEGELRETLFALGAQIEELPIDAPDLPIRLSGSLERARAAAGRQLEVAWDLSVASNQAVMRVIHELLRADVALRVLYAEAAEYFPLREEYEADREGWSDDDRLNLQRGILTVDYCGEYPGDLESQLPHRLILFPGFSRDRAQRLIAKVDVEYLVDFTRAPVTWMIGVPPSPDNFWRRDAVMEIHGIPEEHEIHQLSTFDPRETLLGLERVYGKWSLQHNITLSPMGSKMQALAAGLFCYARPDVRVAFAHPLEYNAGHYSEGVGALWNLPLGETSIVRKLLRQVGTVSLRRDEG